VYKDRTIDEKGVLLTLTVNPADLGRVIGKRGSTAQSLRTLLRALGAKNDARYNLKIVNNDGFSGAREENDYNGNASVDNSTDETVENGSSYAENTRKELAEPVQAQTLCENSSMRDNGKPLRALFVLKNRP